jgi:hypothetical protein
MEVDLDEIKLGDYLKSEVYTYSQKWFTYPEYNSIREGKVVEIKHRNSPYGIMIRNLRGEIVPICCDPGSSGEYIIYKLY